MLIMRKKIPQIKPPVATAQDTPPYMRQGTCEENILGFNDYLAPASRAEDFDAVGTQKFQFFFLVRLLF